MFVSINSRRCKETTICCVYAVSEQVEDRRDVRPRRRYDDDWEVYQWKAGDWGKCVGHCNYGTVFQRVHLSIVG